MTSTSTAVSSTTTFTSVTPNLIVRDIAKSTAFYRDVLGFTIKQTVPDAEPFVFVWLEARRRAGVSERHQGRRTRLSGGGEAAAGRHRRDVLRHHRR